MRGLNKGTSAAPASADTIEQTGDNKRVHVIDEPLLVTVERAGKLLSLGKTSIFTLCANGTLQRRKVGNATRITMCSIRRLAGV